MHLMSAHNEKRGQAEVEVLFQGEAPRLCSPKSRSCPTVTCAGGNMSHRCNSPEEEDHIR